MRWEYRVLIAALVLFVLAVIVAEPVVLLGPIYWISHLMHPDRQTH